MHRIIFHSPSGRAELPDPERARLRAIGLGPARAAWDLDLFTRVKDMGRIIALIPEVPDAPRKNQLHRALRRAQDEEFRRVEVHAATGSGLTDHDPEPHRNLLGHLQTLLHGGGGTRVFEVGGIEVDIYAVTMNTAMAGGSPVVQLAAKVEAWCAKHAWFDGTDRGWLADLIETGLRTGVFRGSASWEQVQTMLRERDDEPVVLSYSVGDSFPNAGIAGYDDERWRALSEPERWAAALAGVRASRPWAGITPGNLGSPSFDRGLTVYDLLAPDREERVRAAAGRSPRGPVGVRLD